MVLLMVSWNLEVMIAHFTFFEKHTLNLVTITSKLN